MPFLTDSESALILTAIDIAAGTYLALAVAIAPISNHWSTAAWTVAIILVTYAAGLSLERGTKRA